MVDQTIVHAGSRAIADRSRARISRVAIVSFAVFSRRVGAAPAYASSQLSRLRPVPSSWRIGGARRRAGRDSLSLRSGITSVVPWLVVSRHRKYRARDSGTSTLLWLRGSRRPS
jgi:hypothetical protein